MIGLYVVLLVAAISGTGYLAYRSQDFRKFLAGAFFVSAGVQFYLAWTGVSIPLAGTNLVQTPNMGLVRASIHAAMFVLTTYLGFIHKSSRSVGTR